VTVSAVFSVKVNDSTPLLLVSLKETGFWLKAGMIPPFGGDTVAPVLSRSVACTVAVEPTGTDWDDGLSVRLANHGL
jgi:hypothetical protein